MVSLNTQKWLLVFKSISQFVDTVYSFLTFFIDTVPNLKCSCYNDCMLKQVFKLRFYCIQYVLDDYIKFKLNSIFVKLLDECFFFTLKVNLVQIDLFLLKFC